MTTPRARDRLALAAGTLQAAGIENPRREARLLLSHVTGRAADRWLIDADVTVGEDDGRRFDELVARRAAHEPLAHLTGEREFWSLSFGVTAATLVPRPDSETLVEEALRIAGGMVSAIRVLDLGTGTGCLLLSVLSALPEAVGVGVDISRDACLVAHRNARRLGLAGRARFVCGDWDASLRDSYDIVLANPPYIPTEEIDGLMTEVADYEPRRALDGGADGLSAYRTIAAGLAGRLALGGRALVEIGAGQADAVGDLMSARGLSVCDARRDLAGIIRCLVVSRAAAS